MDRVEEYKVVAADTLRKYAEHKPVNVDVERQLILDNENGHYQLMSVGWKGNERIHNCVIHLDVIDGKVWVQQDATDIGIADELVEQGIPKSDIVLAFHPPYKRAYTGFGVN